VSAGFELGPDGRARSTRYDDMYQPDIDGAQARAVFLAGNGLPERFTLRVGPFTVLELGFGTGLNFLETWRAWRGAGARCDLRYIGIDAHPLTRAEARSVAEARTRAAGVTAADDLRSLVEAWPEADTAQRELALDRLDSIPVGSLTLTLMHETFERALATLAERAPASVDAVYLDGFAPSKNPSAWSHEVFQALGRVVRPGGTAATWSIAGIVRTGLADAGFEVQRRRGHGPKREQLAAVRIADS
jgi:tRNA 5-methylaminomethyl-2-thiouridine biosynthesis bifunctional protein